MERKHKKLDVWKLSMELVTEIYKIQFPQNEVYALSSQIRRASISIPSNIAECAARGSLKEYIHFLNIANGSLSEVDTQLEICKNLNYISQSQYDNLVDRINVLSIKLINFIKSLKKNL